jgi:hypothetical protein
MQPSQMCTPGPANSCLTPVSGFKHNEQQAMPMVRAGGIGVAPSSSLSGSTFPMPARLDKGRFRSAQPFT